MLLHRIWDPKLAQAGYLIGCSEAREALVIDPTRDVEQYLALAASLNLRVAHVTETHIHADFVSGSRELAARAGRTALPVRRGRRRLAVRLRGVRTARSGCTTAISFADGERPDPESSTRRGTRRSTSRSW